MGNISSLKPTSKMTAEELTEFSRKGQKASMETRRKRKNMKELAKTLLETDVPPTQEQTRAQMRAIGIEDEDMTYAMQVIVAMMIKATKGDVKAANFIYNVAGLNLELASNNLLDSATKKEEVVIYLPDNGRGDSNIDNTNENKTE